MEAEILGIQESARARTHELGLHQSISANEHILPLEKKHGHGIEAMILAVSSSRQTSAVASSLKRRNSTQTGNSMAF